MKVEGKMIKFTALCASWGMALMLGLPARAQPVIAIDAGHVKAAQGARAAVDGRSELFFNVDMAREIAKQSERLGSVTRLGGGVVMEREDFRQRAQLGQGADFFLSVHHDSAKPALLSSVRDEKGERWEDRAGRFKGFALFVDPKDAKGLACARWIGKALVEAGEKPSRYHASPELGESREFLDEAHGVHAFAGLAVARLRKAPMALLEVGVIVNPEESLSLRIKERRERMAQAVAKGMDQCLTKGPSAKS